MAEVQIIVEGEFKKTKYKSLNPKLALITREIFREVVDTIENKSKEYARGAQQPLQRTGDQAQHRIGKSESGYVSTGELEAGIEVSRPPVRGYSFSATILSKALHSSNVEFGTGIYGPGKTPIVPKKEGGRLHFFTPKYGAVSLYEVKGQRPNPFMRGAIWWAQDHIGDIGKSVQSEIKGKKLRNLLKISTDII